MYIMEPSQSNDDSIPWREAFPEYRDEDLPGVSLLGARTKEEMTQTRLAELTGIPQRHLSMMEQSPVPGLDILHKKITCQMSRPGT